MPNFMNLGNQAQSAVTGFDQGWQRGTGIITDLQKAKTARLNQENTRSAIDSRDALNQREQDLHGGRLDRQGLENTGLRYQNKVLSNSADLSDETREIEKQTLGERAVNYRDKLLADTAKSQETIQTSKSGIAATNAQNNELRASAVKNAQESWRQYESQQNGRIELDTADKFDRQSEALEKQAAAIESANKYFDAKSSQGAENEKRHLAIAQSSLGLMYKAVTSGFVGKAIDNLNMSTTFDVEGAVDFVIDRQNGVFKAVDAQGNSVVDKNTGDKFEFPLDQVHAIANPLTKEERLASLKQKQSTDPNKYEQQANAALIEFVTGTPNRAEGITMSSGETEQFQYLQPYFAKLRSENPDAPFSQTIALANKQAMSDPLSLLEYFGVDRSFVQASYDRRYDKGMAPKGARDSHQPSYDDWVIHLLNQQLEAKGWK